MPKDEDVNSSSESSGRSFTKEMELDTLPAVMNSSPPMEPKEEMSSLSDKVASELFFGRTAFRLPM